MSSSELHLVDPEKIVNTTCPYCGVGCGVSVTVHRDNKNSDSSSTSTNISLKGNEQHPANFGKLCVKGSSLAETLGNHQRLLFPARHDKQSQQSERISWSEALDEVAQKIQETIDTYGKESVAFYGSGQLLTEDYYVINKLMKGFIGTGNMDTNSRLCMSSAVSGHKQSFGCDVVPVSYEDLDHADLITFCGSNAAWTHPIVFQRIAQAKKNNPNLKIVVIDPQKTATCDIADLHLAIAPGSDNFLFTGLLDHIAFHVEGRKALDTDFIEQNTEHFEKTTEQARSICKANNIAEVCDIAEEDLEAFYQLFASAKRPITMFSQGINQSATGVNKASNIINCHLATGKIGKQGCGPFSITGQPNAMGGREVGGLANQIAAHMDFSSPDNNDRIGRFWQSENVTKNEGLKAVDLFKKIHSGDIKFVWIMATSPVVSLPESDKIREALMKCPTVVVSESMTTSDTLAYADYHLPALTWGEKDGTVTNSERRISRQKAFLPAPGESKADWWIASEVAKRLGFESAFNYQNNHEIFIEHAQLSGFENSFEAGHKKRYFDISGLAELSKDEYDNLSPIRWPVNQDYPDGCDRVFSNGEFLTPSRKAQFIVPEPELPQRALLNEQYPLTLNTGRIRDQWHTMTRTGRAKRLTQSQAQPYVLINNETAEEYNLGEGDVIKVFNGQGFCISKARIDSGIKPNQVFMPIHWSKSFSANALPSNLTNDSRDKISGQPESKFAFVDLEKIEVDWQAILIGNQSKIDLIKEHLQKSALLEYWACVPTQSAHDQKLFLSGDNFFKQVDNNLAAIETLLKTLFLQHEVIKYFNHYAKEYRFAVHEITDAGRTLVMAFYIEAKLEADNTPAQLDSFDSQWIESLISNTDTLDDHDRHAVLAGRQAGVKAQTGKVICACFQVRDSSIEEYIQDKSDAVSVEELGSQLKCGTNCGSCIPELKGLVSKFEAEKAS